MVLLNDLLVGFERNTPHFEQLFAPQLIRNMAACETWGVFPIYFRFVFHFRFSFLFAWFHFYLRGFFFVCVVPFLFAWFLFCLRGSIFICVVYFLFAWFLFHLLVFFFVCVFSFFVCVVSFFVCVSLVGHRRLYFLASLFEVNDISVPI